MKGQRQVKKTITTALLLTSSLLFAFDPLSVDFDNNSTDDDESLAYILLYYSGGPWKGGLNSLAKKHGNEKVGERIVEFMEPVFDKACVSTYNDREYMLCEGGMAALGFLKATNTLSFLERAVLHGREDLCKTALKAYLEITGYGESYIDLLDRALENGAITRDFYATKLTGFIWSINHGRTKVTSEIKHKIAIRHMKNPDGYYREGSGNDDFILAIFPPYSNSVERITALTAMLENQLTPPEGHAKYGPERDRLKALPPESLVRVTDELEAQLDALLKAAEHKRKIEQVKKYAVPAGIAILVLAVLAVLFRRRGKKQ